MTEHNSFAEALAAALEESPPIAAPVAAAAALEQPDFTAMLDAGVVVELFHMINPQGQNAYRFSPHFDKNNQPIRFGGHEYQPLPVQITDYELKSTGTLPQPTLTVGALHEFKAGSGLMFRALVEAHGDFIGYDVEYMQVLGRNIDTGEAPNPNAAFNHQKARIERKTSDTRTAISFAMKSPLEMENSKLPRLAFVPYCQRIYRSLNAAGTGFVYQPSANGCPYNGSKYFDVHGKPTTMDKDCCSKNLEGCQARFGKAALPILGFPGIRGY